MHKASARERALKQPNRISRQEYLKFGYEQVSEKTFQARVERVLRVNGWLVFHTHRSDRSAPGFPDICAVHEGRHLLLFAELKTMRGKLGTHQKAWLKALRFVEAKCFGFVHVCVWRPDQYEEIVKYAGWVEPLV